jgi:hypothetical protein
MEKRILVASYWLGVLSTVLALISRCFLALDYMPPRFGAAGGVAISYLSFFHGAALFFMLAIATWCKSSMKS